MYLCHVFVHHPEIDINVNIMLRDLLCPELLKHRSYIFQISKPQSFDPGWNYNLLIFGQAPKPSCLGVRQEDSCLPKLVIQKVQ